jgi:hypothetical protein
VSRQRILGLEHLLRRPRSRDFAALVAGAGAEVEQIIGGRNDLAIMLDEHERVAQVAQVLQGLK